MTKIYIKLTLNEAIDRIVKVERELEGLGLVYGDMKTLNISFYAERRALRTIIESLKEERNSLNDYVNDNFREAA